VLSLENSLVLRAVRGKLAGERETSYVRLPDGTWIPCFSTAIGPSARRQGQPCAWSCRSRAERWAARTWSDGGAMCSSFSGDNAMSETKQLMGIFDIGDNDKNNNNI